MHYESAEKLSIWFENDQELAIQVGEEAPLLLEKENIERLIKYLPDFLYEMNLRQDAIEAAVRGEN